MAKKLSKYFMAKMLTANNKKWKNSWTSEF